MNHTALMKKQLSIRGFDDELKQAIERVAGERGISLNKAVLYLVRKGAGLDRRELDQNVIGDSLDKYMGSMSEEDHQQLNRALEPFNQIDDELWK